MKQKERRNETPTWCYRNQAVTFEHQKLITASLTRHGDPDTVHLALLNPKKLLKYLKQDKCKDKHLIEILQDEIRIDNIAKEMCDVGNAMLGVAG